MSCSVAVIGECMLELSPADQGGVAAGFPMNMSYGGDTLNTAVYLSRIGVSTRYVTALGDDVLSDWLVQQWKNEGIDCSQVVRMPNAVPGMYMINVADDGERSFLYWRKNSPASQLFDDADRTEKLFQSLSKFSHLYLSGISLGILPEQSLQGLFAHLRRYRRAGGKIIFDGNYRPNLWEEATRARQIYRQIYEITDVALPTLEDESLLFGFESAAQVVDALKEYGITDIVVKMGRSGCLLAHENTVQHVDTVQVMAVDTTAAGDSFNAAFIAARLDGGSMVEACSAGNKLASRVVQHRGAIIPRSSC